MDDITTFLAMLCVGLVLALFLVVRRAKARIVEEKMATFAGCLNAITAGLGQRELDDRVKMVALGLGGVRGSLDHEDFRWRLVRASILRALRGSSNPTIADIGGEHMRVLSLTSVAASPNSAKEAESVWSYIDGAMAKPDGFQQEPLERFGTDGLARVRTQLSQ